MLENHSPLSAELLLGKDTSHPSPVGVGERDAPSPFYSPDPRKRWWSPAYSPRCLSTRWVLQGAPHP